ncbi:MAG: DUF5995 family protein [Sandaracinaceae bacterium]
MGWDFPREIHTMKESIEVLDDLIGWGQREESPIGYFAALYRKVGWAIEAALQAGKFEHPDTLVKLDVVFFNRYLEALHLWHTGEGASAPWQIAFDATRDEKLIVLQHLAMAMNAHIDLDLGVATADVVPEEDLLAFRKDFDTMNAVLASLMHDVENDMGLIFALLKPINCLFGPEEDGILDLSMDEVRARAWANCLRLSRLEGEARAEAIERLAASTATLSCIIRDPGPLGSLAVQWIRRRESGDVAQKIEDLTK